MGPVFRPLARSGEVKAADTEFYPTQDQEQAVVIHQPMAPSRRREDGDCWLWAINDGVVAESNGAHSVEPSTLRATVVRALGANEARYSPMWDSLAPQTEIEVLPTWDD